ncbi:GntR family transcriptional regulator [Staphylococcus nepalensis]|uniref:GntR family transcriptional regulator n=1 Tax=Staphylococcus nepalensis TaxID=214473 RepID=UPI001A9852F2|nr:GntR family transcriptional regulator [Staphylococcus nepalensis]MBO1217450.1 GntR family transcriptional regulator [Staphylococcus nepalensis]
MKKLKAPLYFQVYEDIKQKIQNGQYKEGEQLPSERNLYLQYDVSRITVREALKILEKEGYIRREHGRGSYVLGSQYNQMLNSLYNFKDEIEKNGDQPRTIMLSIKKIDSTQYLQKKMQIQPYQKVYELRRLRLANEKPLIYETSYLPVKFCEGLEKFNFNKLSLYNTLNKHYDIRIIRAYENLTPKKLTESQANYLDTDINDVCMFIERFSYIEEGIIEYTETVAKAKDYKYTVKLLD